LSNAISCNQPYDSIPLLYISENFSCVVFHKTVSMMIE
jgi:hypothetical protein